MIQASKRKREKKSQDQIHTSLAQQKRLHFKLTAAGILSSVISLLLWLSGVSLFIHLIGILVSFIIGLFYPSKNNLNWALKHIEKSTGLSYQTALEHPSALPYGLDTALNSYAKRSLSRLEAANFRRWWLPLMVISFGLTLLPYTPFRSSPRSVGLPGLENNFLTGTNAEKQNPAETLERQAEQDPQQASPNQVNSQETSRPQTLDDALGSNGQGLNDLAENVADEKALSRFLENLRERELAEENQTTPPAPQRATEPSSRQGQAGQEGDADSQQQAQSAEEQANSEGQPQEGEGNSSENGRDGEQTSSSTEPTPENSDSSSEASSSSENQAQDQGASSSGEQAADDGSSQSQLDGSDEGNDGSGIGSSTARESLGLNSELNRDDPEFLQGQLQQGASNLAGTVRLPGASDQEIASFGPAAEGFQRAEEQAVTEGRIPIEYQEIIKNYFR